MNANSQPQTPAIKDWLADSSRLLSDVGISSAKLDAELLLSSALKENRTYLHAHPETKLSIGQLKLANQQLQKRLERQPIAYLLGYKEFYGRNFIVSPDTLIPRPESEIIIEILISFKNDLIRNKKFKLIDVGTGSGCLGISAKLEIPNLDVALSDLSTKALDIARKNAQKLAADVKLINSDLLNNVPQSFDIIIANLPYVDQSWERSPETDFEPSMALFADRGGMDLIEKLIIQSEKSLRSGGLLVLEAEPAQHKQIIAFASNYNLRLNQKNGYIICFDKLN